MQNIVSNKTKQTMFVLIAEKMIKVKKNVNYFYLPFTFANLTKFR